MVTKLNEEEVASSAAWALGRLQDLRAVKPLMAKLDDNLDIRSEALGALANICRDEIDQKLLSKEIDIDYPWLDPKESITEKRVAEAVSKLKLTQEEVRQRYEDLAREFNLKLEWVSTTD